MLISLPYQRQKAVDYAAKWYDKRNPRYLNFDGIGGDCTNFISQCLYAGAGVQNFTPVTGWYYNSSSDRTASWTGVEYLYNFLIKNKSVGPYALETDISSLHPGDIIQLGNSNKFYHSLLVTEIGDIPDLNNILVSTHTFDAHRRPLASYSIQKIRYLHIEGVRKYQ